MYTVTKRIEVSGAHHLELNYESKCSNLHGHNWIIDISMRSKTLDANGMVMDFSHIKKSICDALDHKYINDVVPYNPTAENIAKWICDTLGPKCFRVIVQESEGNVAMYERD